MSRRSTLREKVDSEEVIVNIIINKHYYTHSHSNFNFLSYKIFRLFASMYIIALRHSQKSFISYIWAFPDLIRFIFTVAKAYKKNVS